MLYESLTNVLELKDFRFSLWQVFLPCMFYMKVQPIYWNQRTFVFRCGRFFCHVCLYEKAASKATSAEPPPRWAIGTGQLSCLQFRSGPIARRGGGGIIPFSIFVVSGRTCPLYESLTNILELKDFRFSLWQVLTAMYVIPNDDCAIMLQAVIH